MFAKSLAKLAHEIVLPEPLFKGRIIRNEVPYGTKRWIIDACVKGREVDPRTDDITVNKCYGSW